MNSERWQQVKILFDEAITLEPERRGRFLSDACKNDDELRREIEILLNSFEDAESFMESPAAEDFASLIVEKSEKPENGEQISHYEILSQIGEGGMGEVFLAKDTRLNRKVALKLLAVHITEDKNRASRFRQEAFATSALNHPNIVTIYEIGEWKGRDFIATEFIEGMTLRSVMQKKKLSIGEALDIALQIASALAAAHGAGIVHRDIKPENIMIRPDGLAKILDFGIAKYMPSEDGRKALVETKVGEVMGTAAYMSPEQARGLEIDERTDIWSLGVILYEMIARKLPFQGSTRSDRIAAILEHEPAPIKKFRRDVPPELEKIVSRALAKNKEERYRKMEDLAEDLHKIRDKSGIERRSAFTFPSVKPQRKFAWNYTAAALIILLLASGAAWYYWRNANLRWAEESVGKVEELAQNDKYFEAYDLALQVEKYLPQNPVIAQLMPTISDKLTVTTEPDGARVFLKRFQPDDKGNFPERQLIGTTPINDLRIARGQYVLAIEKDGYAPLERTISGTTNRLGTKVIRITPPLRVEAKLVEAGKQPANMVLVKGGEYKLVTWSRPTESPVKLSDFFIDKYEVSNREYKEFINAGGYLKQEYWKFPFVKDGKTLTWEEAMREFKDRTALQAPRNWTSQNFPEGKAEHPVTDITWYEAAAYAAFRGKSLPTIHQWEKAARDGMRDFLVVTMPWGLFKPGEATDFRANFNGIGTTAVNSFEFGMSPYGCYNTAGNVSEWCQNKRGDGFITSGGSWADPVYLFGQYGSYPGFYSSNKLGFRCVLNLPDAVGDQGAIQFSEEDEIPVFSPPKEADFKAILSHYHYDKTPLEAEIVETKETDEWRREKITFNGAEGERVVAYLYLPKNYARPLQVIHYYPADDVWFGFRSLQDSMDLALSPFIKSGRAVFGVAVKGYVERRHPPNYKRPEPNTVEYRRQVINGAIDLRRGLDYLETRSDIDAGKIAMMSFSNGSPMMLGWIVSALDSRYRSMIITGIGARPDWAKWIAEANPLNFVSHIRHPKLIMNGRYDESTPLKTEAEPFFKLLPEPKRLMLYDGGHVPPIEIFIPAANAWFDETLGAVKRE